MKKINKVKQLKEEIAELKERVDGLDRDKNYYHKILIQIDKILFLRNSGRLFEEIPLEIMKLHEFRQTHEGAKHIFADIVESQREIIRWLIKPSSADNAKELQMLRKGRFQL